MPKPLLKMLYSDEQLVDYVFAGLCATTKDIYKTALQLYQLERRQGNSFSLGDAEQNFFEIDEELGRGKNVLRSERALAVADHRQKRGNYRNSSSNNPTLKSNSQRRFPTKSGRFTHPSTNAATGNNIICFKCGAPGHIAPNCPHDKQTNQRKIRSSVKSNTANSTGGSDVNNKHELVCLAKAIQSEKAFATRQMINSTNYPTLSRPRPQPIPVINTDFTGAEMMNTTQYITLALPINHGQFNELLEF
jgi:hypothetical protein